MSESRSTTEKILTVYDWTRTHVVVGGQPFLEHLSEDELAGLVEGALLPAERVRIENHASVCVACRDTAGSLVRDYPLLSRAAGENPRPVTRSSMKVGRRLSPWIAAILVFGIVFSLPWSWQMIFSSGDLSADSDYFVVGRIGTPTYHLESGERRPAETGGFIERGTRLFLESGDVVTCLAEDGSLKKISPRGIETSEPSDPFFAGIHRDAAARRRAARALLPTSRSSAKSTVEMTLVEPRGTIVNDRPRFLWADVLPRQSYKLIVREDDAQGREVLNETLPSSTVSADWPRHVAALGPGKTYRVRLVSLPLTAIGAAECTFTTVDDERKRRITDDLRALEKRLHRSASMVRIEYLYREGLYNEAAAELARLRAEDQSNGELIALAADLARRLDLIDEADRLDRLLEKRSH